MTNKELKHLRELHDDAIKACAEEATKSMKEFIKLVEHQRNSRSWFHKFMDWITGWDILYKVDKHQ